MERQQQRSRAALRRDQDFESSQAYTKEFLRQLEFLRSISACKTTLLTLTFHKMGYFEMIIIFQL